MKSIIRKIQYRGVDTKYRLYLLSDTHEGAKGSETKLIKSIVDEISQDDNALWAHLGDFGEYINLGDKRFDPDSIADWLYLGRENTMGDIARAETARVIETFAPIKDKCVALVEGNHEATMREYCEHDCYSVIIDGLADGDNEHRLGHRGVVYLRFNRSEGGGSTAVKIFLTHGSGSASTAGSTLTKLYKYEQQLDGVDVVAMGHLHYGATTTIQKYRCEPTYVSSRSVHLISCPPLCGMMQYADRMDRDLRTVGYVVLTIWPYTREISVDMRVFNPKAL